jgi:dTDP-4-amino-4,6-dideoxygalactose transaminase
MPEPISFVDISSQQMAIRDEVLPLVEQILEAGAFIGGPHVAAFESAFAAFIGVKHAIGVANGTDGLEIALRAAGVRAGDEVVMPANTFIATAEAVDRMGAVVRLVDADENYLLIDPDLVPAAVTDRTKAVIPVHLYGQAAPVESIVELDLPNGSIVLEDAAQSQGAKRRGRLAGSLGDIASTSFYPGKNLGAAGDAGAVMTDDDSLARRARLIGAHGSATKYVHEVPGFNSRLDAIQAVVLSAKLTRLIAWNSARAEAAKRYDRLLAEIHGVVRPGVLEGNEPVWHLYTVRVPNRDKVIDELAGESIGVGIHYPEPIHLTSAFHHLGYQKGDFPVTERAANRLLSLPMHAHLTSGEQERVAESLARAIDKHGDE